MNIEEQQKQFDAMVDLMRSTMFKKGNDYSNEDRLSNFKLGGAIIGLTPQMQCLALISTKVARLGSLLSGNKTPNNESISDTLLDLANYTLLLDMIIKDRNE